MEQTKIRSECCCTCPFQYSLPKRELEQVLEGYPNHDPNLEVLCHTDGFLVGEDHADYSLCRGFRLNALRVGLL